MEQNLNFPKGFLWGSATSAYQVEGGIENCDWAKVYPAGQACDHYNLCEEDFGLIKSLNQNAYRFSIEWSRIEPEEGQWDEKEIEHYQKVILALKTRDIEPFVTLHHFTLPVWFADKGGFEKEENIFYFVRFTNKIFGEYHNLVKFWLTINEPLIYASQGYFKGIWPPQRRNLILLLKIIKNLVFSHRRIYEHFRKLDSNTKIGVAHNLCFFEPHNRKSILDNFSVFLYRYFWDEWFLNRIKHHLDFIGVNYYFHEKVKFPFLNRSENKVISDIDWEIYPKGVYHVLKDLQKYRLPIYITENGLADAKDKLRKDFIKNHLFWVHKAIEEGINIRGYLHWSLMDNFEWKKGFGPKFGLVEIDYKTMERKPRPSAFYYAEICKNNNLVI